METIKKLDEQNVSGLQEVHKSWIQQHCITAVQGKVTIPETGKQFDSILGEDVDVVIHKPITVTTKDELISEVVRAYPSDKYNVTKEQLTALVEEVLAGSTTEGTFERFCEVLNEK